MRSGAAFGQNAQRRGVRPECATLKSLPLRFVLRLGFVLSTALAIALAASCDDEGTSRELGVTRDAGPPRIEVDGQAGDSQAQPPVSTMRLAHLAAEVGPLDFCYQGAKKGTFVGPVLGATSPPPIGDAGDAEDDHDAEASLDEAPDDAGDAGDAGDGGEEAARSASYGTVSSYRNLQATGPITIAILQAGSTSCANALATADVTLDPGKLSTVAVFGKPGDGGTALEIAAFTDDRTTRPDRIRVRVIHAALGTTKVPGTGPIAARVVAAKTTVLANRIEPRRAATAEDAIMVDALGYVTGAPIPAPASIAIGPASSDAGADAGFEPWQSTSSDLELFAGSLHTAFVLVGPTESTFEVLWCADTTTAADRTLCRIVR